jgi:HEAT repeat protein
MRPIAVFLLVVLVAACSGAAFADDPLPPTANKKLIEDNLFVGLESDNAGLQRSCAYMLGVIQSSRATIPLMRELRFSEDEDMRVAAAWALCRIGSGVGVYAVKTAVRYDDSEKVQNACAWFYETYVKGGTFVFKESQPSLAVSSAP